MDHTVNKQEYDTSESHRLPWQTPSLQDNQQTPLVCTYWHFLRIWTFWRFFDENTIENRRSLYNFSGGLFVQWGRQIGDSREQTGLRYPGIATASRVEVVGSSRPRNKVWGILNKKQKPQCRTWSFSKSNDQSPPALQEITKEEKVVELTPEDMLHTIAQNE